MHEKINSPHYIIKLAQEMRRNLTAVNSEDNTLLTDIF